MPIPGFQEIFLPLLKFAADKKEHSMREAIEALSSNPFNLSEEERKELLPSGQQAIFDNRTGWSRTYLKKAGLLESKKRGFFNITEEGLKVLEENPEVLNTKFLKRYPEFVKFHDVSKKETDDEIEDESVDNKTPEEVLEDSYQSIREDLSQELLEKIKSCPPDFFERLVVDVLLAMGYGGSRKDAGEAVGKTNDGGIDGIIKEDKLGLDVIYIQAKRWNSNVGSREIRDFIGSLDNKNANKGVFITTSDFTIGALESTRNSSFKIILINGELLSDLMIDHEVGVSKVITYEIKRIDTDYFMDE